MRLSAQRTILVFAIAGSLVLLNVLVLGNTFGLHGFKRFDWTRDRMYTLSPATREMLSKLEDPVTISAYFTENLPPPYSQNPRYVRDLLEEYRSAANGKLVFEMFDPARQESEKDKEKKKEVKRDFLGRAYREQTDVEKELAAAGLEPVAITVIEEDQRQDKRVYMGLVIKYHDQREVIPVVQSTEGLEYDLTNLIKKLTRKRAPVLGLALPEAPVSAAAQEPPHYEQLRQLFGQVYEVKELNLAGLTEVPNDVDALFIVAPGQPVPEAAQKAIDAFMMKGKGAAFLLDSVKVDVRSFSATPVEHGLRPLLESYGVKIGDGLIADVACASLSVQEQRGMLRLAIPVKYFFIPMVPGLQGESPLSRGLTNLPFPFASPLTLVPKDGLQEMVLASSSAQSWIEKQPYDTNPRRDWREANPTFGGPYSMMVQVTGKLKSHFGAGTASGDARLVVVSGAGIALDELQGQMTQALLLNISDFLLLDPGMLTMRIRGLSEPALRPNLSDSIRNGVKYGNAVGVPLVLAAIGLIAWRMRERRRRLMSV